MKYSVYLENGAEVAKASLPTTVVLALQAKRAGDTAIVMSWRNFQETIILNASNERIAQRIYAIALAWDWEEVKDFDFTPNAEK